MAKILDLVRGKAERFVTATDLDDPLVKRKIPELRERDIVSIFFL